MPPDAHRRSRPVAAVAGIALLAAAAPVTPPVSSAQPVVAVIELDLVDPTRPTAAGPGVVAATSRTLPTTVHLPPAGAPAPLIVLAHGASGAPDRFDDLATAWARAGYVVAAPRFPLTNEDVGPPVLTEFAEQGRDVQFVVDAVLEHSARPDGELAGRVDPERIGLYGLSLGSLSVWSAAGEPGGGRIDALVQSDGATLTAAVASVPFPVFVAHSDSDPIFAYADAVARYDELPGPKFLLTLPGAAHAAVGEDTLTPADELYRQATTAFWDRTLGGRPDAAFPASVEGVAAFVEGARPPALPGVL